ncbi:MAG TPA: hypothetical protein DCS82_07820 [Rhodospirillaceae bacterium]|nr:hypothetical protein [Rhodospirillaceae bacterium]
MVIDSIKAGRIVNHYQPKIDLSSNEVLGVEALTRLSSPDGELMAPEFFIPVAERHQLINELTRSVIEQAVCDLCTLDDIAPEYSLAINFSINSLSRIEMADFLMSVLDEHSFDCRRLIAEVTESQAIQEGQTPLANLTRLRLHGVTLSVDDFGTGYATLAQLEQIPFQEIKLDKYFVSKVCNDRTSRAIVESTIAMARSLSMRVVAEGIHNAATQDAVTKLGVDHGQGFHISPPLPFDGLADFISDYGQPESTL